MKHRRLLVIDCGETTCASSPGVFCAYVRTGTFGTRWYCHLYSSKELYAVPDSEGWLQRLPACRADFERCEDVNVPADGGV
jgi:hypothetical protein